MADKTTEKATKAKKTKKSVNPDYIGRPKPMKVKKQIFHKPTVGNYIEMGIAAIAICFIVYIGVRLANVGSVSLKNVQRYEYKADSQPASYVMENGDLRFEMDPATTQFAVTQKSTGRVWTSNPLGADDDKYALAKEKQNMKSTLLLKFSTENGVDTIYDSYSYSIAKGVYQISQKGNEVTVDYSLGEIEQKYIYPMAMTEKKMDKWLEKESSATARSIKSNYRRLEKGTFLPSDDVAQLMKDYPALEDEAVFVIRDNLQTYLKEKNEKTWAKLGYTMEDYEEDIQMYAGAKEKKVPGFNVTVIYRLENGNLSVEVPFDKITYKADYPIIRLSILPFFGAAGSEDKGFLFVPEGGGSTINFNNGKTKQNPYYADIYGWDYGTDRKAVMTETRAAFPVFGISYGDSSFISIIESGAEYAGINADVGGRMNGYNYVYSEYKMLHAEQYEASSRNINTQYAYERGLPEGQTIKQVYSFVSGGSYVDMAKTYRSYLFGDKATLKNDSVPVAVEVVGAVDKVQQVAGIPKTRPYTLTTYKEAGEIIKSIDGIGIKNSYIKLSGFFNEGVRQKILRKVKYIGKLGGSSGFKNMIKEADKTSSKLYLDGTVQFSHRSDIFDGFSKYKDSARFASSKVAELSEYSAIWYGKDDTKDTFYLIKPSVTEKLVNKFAKEAKKSGVQGVSFRDLGAILSADYNPKAKVTRMEASALQCKEFESVKAEGLGLMLNNGNAYCVRYADFVTNLSMHGNEYAILDKNVPFYQIALHGNVNFAGTPINIAPEYKQGILEAAEAGSGLSFTFIGETEKALQETNYTQYFAANYEKWESKLEDLYKSYNKDMKNVVNSLIKDHQYIGDAVTVTTFDNGYRVFVNFGYTDFTTADGMVIPAREYKVTEAR